MKILPKSGYIDDIKDFLDQPRWPLLLFWSIAIGLPFFLFSLYLDFRPKSYTPESSFIGRFIMIFAANSVFGLGAAYQLIKSYQRRFSEITSKIALELKNKAEQGAAANP
jgi:hypothetical protein